MFSGFCVRGPSFLQSHGTVPSRRTHWFFSLLKEFRNIFHFHCFFSSSVLSDSLLRSDLSPFHFRSERLNLPCDSRESRSHGWIAYCELVKYDNDLSWSSTFICRFFFLLWFSVSETIIVLKSFRHPDDDARDGSRPRKNTSKSFVKEHVLNYVRALRRRFQFKLHFILNRGSCRARLTSYNVLFDWIQDKSVHFITLNPSSVQVRHDWRKNAVHILDHLVHFVQSFPSSASKNWTSKLYQYPYAYLDKFLSKRHLSFLVHLCSPYAWKLSQPHLHRKRLVGGHDWHHLDLGGLPNTNGSQSVSAHELSRHLSLRRIVDQTRHSGAWGNWACFCTRLSNPLPQLDGTFVQKNHYPDHLPCTPCSHCVVHVFLTIADPSNQLHVGSTHIVFAQSWSLSFCFLGLELCHQCLQLLDLRKSVGRNLWSLLQCDDHPLESLQLGPAFLKQLHLLGPLVVDGSDLHLLPLDKEFALFLTDWSETFPRRPRVPSSESIGERSSSHDFVLKIIIVVILDLRLMINVLIIWFFSKIFLTLIRNTSFKRNSSVPRSLTVSDRRHRSRRQISTIHDPYDIRSSMNLFRLADNDSVKCISYQIICHSNNAFTFDRYDESS